MSQPRVDLDQTREPWVGTFPGLGEVHVFADGAVDVRPADGDPDGEQARALRHGWGRPLAWHRRGLVLLGGVALTPPPHDRGVLMVGSPREMTAWSHHLAEAGWRWLADRPAPAERTDAGYLLRPDDAPIVAARASAGDGERVRQDTDARIVERARHPQPLPLQAVLCFDDKQADPEVHEMRGRDRLVTASSLEVGGVFDVDAEGPAQRFQRAAALAALAMGRVRGEPNDDLAVDVDLVQRWVASQ